MSMDLAFSTLGCPGWTVEQAVEACGTYGYDAIEWRVVDGDVLSPLTPPQVLDRVQAACATHGVRVSCVDTSIRLVTSDRDERERAVEEAEVLGAFAVRLGCPMLRVFGGRVPDGMSHADALAAGAETLEAVCSVASQHGLAVAVENHDDWSSTRAVLSLIAAADAPAAKLLWDVQHSIRAGDDIHHSIELMTAGPGIAHVHLKDAIRTADGMELRIPGEGEFPIPDIVRALSEAGYGGALSFEWEKLWQPQIPEPEQALPAYVSVVRAALGRA